MQCSFGLFSDERVSKKQLFRINVVRIKFQVWWHWEWCRRMLRILIHYCVRLHISYTNFVIFCSVKYLKILGLTSWTNTTKCQSLSNSNRILLIYCSKMFENFKICRKLTFFMKNKNIEKKWPSWMIKTKIVWCWF